MTIVNEAESNIKMIESGLDKQIKDNEKASEEKVNSNKYLAFLKKNSRMITYFTLVAPLTYSILFSGSGDTKKKKPQQFTSSKNKNTLQNLDLRKEGRSEIAKNVKLKNEVPIKLDLPKIKTDEEDKAKENKGVIAGLIGSIGFSEDKSQDKRENGQEDKEEKSLPPLPTISSISKEDRSANMPNPANGGLRLNPKNQNAKAAETYDDMFVKFETSPSKSNVSSSGSMKDDFIILDSSIQVSEIKTSDNQNINISTIANPDNTILKGQFMEAILEMPINSELPGVVRAVISKDVKSESNKVVIPSGSKVYGRYATLDVGSSRLAVSWDRLVRPDGIIIAINADATDEGGRTGILGDVDMRYGSMFQNSLLVSFVSLATAIATQKAFNITGQTQVANPGTGSITTANITPVNAAMNSIVSTTSDIAKKVTEKLSSEIKPVTVIPQGTVILVVSAQDITDIPVWRNYDLAWQNQ